MYHVKAKMEIHTAFADLCDDITKEKGPIMTYKPA
jgi:hypothetical protein